MHNKHSNNRREFFKDSARLAGGLAAMSLAANSLFAASSNTQSKTQGDNMKTQVWYITGASGGFGLELAKYALAKGDKVAATSRKMQNIQSKLGKESENFLPLELTFTGNMNAKIAANFQAIEKKFGRIDNVVNNAGYGLLGFVEEISEKQLREQFEVNVFAPFLIAQNALKMMRPQSLKEGGSSTNIRARIFNLSSIGGFRVSNNSTPYCMSKFAISAFSEGLNLDVKEYGIHTINVMPAGFRTEFLGTSMVKNEIKIADYEKRREAYLQRTASYSGKQAGNPQKFAEILYKLSRDNNPPEYLFMGEAAFKAAEGKIAAVQRDMKATQGYAGAAADFTDGANSPFK